MQKLRHLNVKQKLQLNLQRTMPITINKTQTTRPVIKKQINSARLPKIAIKLITNIRFRTIIIPPTMEKIQ